MLVFCRACGKQIEAEARFCRFCGKAQANGPKLTAGQAAGKARAGSTGAVERWVRQVFPRHHLQDEITHFLTIAALVIGVVGFLLALFPPLGAGLYALAWLLFAILLLLFVMHRDATASRGRQAGDGPALRYQATRGGSPDRADSSRSALSEPQAKK